MTNGLSPLFGWRGALVGANGPGDYVFIDEKDVERKIKAATIRQVGLTLSLHMNERGGSCFPAVATLANECAVSDRTVQRAVRALVELGWLSVKARSDGQRQTSNLYEATIPILGEGEGDPGTPPGVTGMQGEGDPGTPQEDVSEDDKGGVPGKESFVLAWLAHSPPLPAHRDAYFAKSKVKNAVKGALKVYSPSDVAKAIQNYASILSDPRYFWSHRWTFQEFLDRGLDKFVDEAIPFENFHANRDRDSAGGQQRSPETQLQSAEAWILNTAWRLPLEEYEIAEQLGQRGVEGPDRSRLLDLWRQKRELAA